MSTDDLVTPGGLVVPAAALTWAFSRSGGPGGQHVNVTASRVELRCDTVAAALPARVVDRLGAEVRVVVDTHRSQARNRAEALERLAARLDEASRPPPPRRRPTRPSRAAVERRLEAKRRTAERKARRRDAPDG